MAKTITLEKNNKEYTIIVDDDIDLGRHRWVVRTNKRSSVPYVHARIGGKDVKLHQFVLSISGGSNHIHHKNGNGLDNRRENLAVLSPSAHAQLHTEQEHRRANKIRKTNGKWRLTVKTPDGHRVAIGSFDNFGLPARILQATQEYFKR